MSLEPKLLIHRYKLQHRYWLNTYSSFSNAIQFPGLLNIAGHHASLNKTPNLHLHPLTLYDYFGFGMSNLFNTCTDRNCQNNFDLLNPLDVSCKSLFQSERKPPFFFIKSRLVIQSRKGGYEGRLCKNHSFEDHYVAVVYKDNYYYICPGEENSVIYRVGCPERIFLTEEGHGVLSIILRESLGTNFELFRFRLLIPKQHLNQSFGNISNWDSTSKYEIEFHLPFPVLQSAAVSNDCHSSVQVVTLDDNDFIVDVMVDGKGHDGSDDENLDLEEDGDITE